jgi:hypothetical protein
LIKFHCRLAILTHNDKARMTLDPSKGIDAVNTLTNFGEEGLPGFASIIEDQTVNGRVTEVAQYAIKRINQGLA